MTTLDLAAHYHEYIACLNRQDWVHLQHYVSNSVRYNEKPCGFTAYREMLVGNYRDIPNLRFQVGMLVVEGELVASRLIFDCAPISVFLGLDVNGRRVSFTENVFYRFDDGRIEAVWSVVDKAAIEAQLQEK